MTDCLLIIPAYNEQENIVSTVESIRDCGCDFVVINDGSRDDTARICRQHGYPLIDLKINLGLAGAFQAGMRYADEHGYAYALQFDADGQHRPQYIRPMLTAARESGADVVIGSRFLTEKKPDNLRMFGSRILTCAIRIATGKRVADPTSGMRLYNRKMIGILSRSINCGPEPDTLVYLIRSGARVREVQVTMQERQAGTSYLTLGRSAAYMLRMVVSILLIQAFRK